MFRGLVASALLLWSLASWAGTVVVIQTTAGDITLELNDEKAPKTVANFLSYVDSGFYKNTVFHRVIPNFMIQGGGYDADSFQRKATNPPIQNEANNGLKNVRGSIAMARTGAPHSATAQFFINSKDNRSLDFTNEHRNGWGYCVFGSVSAGLDVVDSITRRSPPGPNGVVPKNKQAEAIRIIDIVRSTEATVE